MQTRMVFTVVIFCVHHVAREKFVYIDRMRLALCFGSFHVIETVLTCIGKYLGGSGCKTI